MNAVDCRRSEVNPGAQRDATAPFSKRVAAAWIDCFVVYTIATLLITLTDMTRARIALEPLYILVGAAYGAALLTQRGQTIGKMLTGIAVSVREGDQLRLRHVLLREVFGKWGIGVATPVALGRVLLGQPWMESIYDRLILWPGVRDAPGIVLQSTVYDALILSSALLFQLVHYVIAKRTWYDQLAGTVVERTAGARRRPGLALPP